MNEQLPPIDSDLREQLARRSAGRLPEGLASEVFSALDSGAARRPIWRVPRLAVAGMSMALVAILAVTIAFSFHTAPAASPTSLAGYPAERALTTAELASLMAGPPLPVNTALVASVTIQSRQDVCPMNSRPTVGVVEGMGSQVCVMGADLSAQLPGPTTTGTFAFRYLAPGHLGMLGQIAPAASRLAFKVGDSWPDSGTPFLVDGWLIGSPLPCPSMAEVPPGDPLDASGSEPCVWSWLSDGGSLGPDLPGSDGPALQGKTLLVAVAAGGARQIDAIPLEATHGVFVVRAVTAPCPSAAPQDSRGCDTWRILAKLADVTLPAPNATVPMASPSAAASPAPPATPVIGSYPVDRPLTAAELGRAMAAGLPAGQVVVVRASFAQTNGCSPNDRYPAIGTLIGLSQDICVVGIADGSANHTPADTSGVFALRVLDGRTLGFMATIDPPSADRLAYRADESWPTGKTILVSGWLVAGSSVSSCGMIGAVTPEPLDPGGVPCGQYWISPRKEASPVATVEPGSGFRQVSLPDYPEIGGGLLPPAQTSAVYLVRDENRCQSGAVATDSSVNTSWDKLCGWQIMARVDPVTVPPEPAASPAPTPTPTTAPPATPIPEQSGLDARAPVGRLGSGNRPLTVAEFPAAWASDPAHLAGRTVIVKGPIPTGFKCTSAGTAAPSATWHPGCDVTPLDGQIAPDGYWAVLVGYDGRISLIGAISVPQSGFVFSLDQVNASTTLKDGELVIVDGWLLERLLTCNYDATPVPAVCVPSEIGSMPQDQSPASVAVQLGAYKQIVGTEGDWYTNGPPVHGLFLLRLQNSGVGTLLVRLEAAAP